MRSLLVLLASVSLASAAEWEVVVSPRVTVIEQEGITGGGRPVKAGRRVLNFFPDHPDDFGGTKGMACTISGDGGLTWTKGPNNWPMPKMVAMWADPLSNGDLLAFGIHWLPDSAKRRDPKPQFPTADAYQMGTSKDGGRTWELERARIYCPPDIGYIARPLPHIIEQDELLLMPAYTWSKRGNKVVLLASSDGGRNWNVRSVITTAVAMIQAGTRVSTPWLESTISPTTDGALLAVVRAGSTVKSKLVSTRSSDGGKTWNKANVLPFAGKLPNLKLLENDVLTLTTALSRNHCRVYLSADGTGRKWSDAFIVSSLTGGNVGVTITGKNNLLITTPANRRIDAYHLRVAPKPKLAKDLTSPFDSKFSRGILTWLQSSNAVAYRVTPVLVKPGKVFSTTLIHRYAVIQTETARLDLRRQLLPGGQYAFEITAVDAEGRISSTLRTEAFQL
ncbi:MAG: sialidase family protein [Limisphaerales bacterium]